MHVPLPWSNLRSVRGATSPADPPLHMPLPKKERPAREASTPKILALRMPLPEREDASGATSPGKPAWPVALPRTQRATPGPCHCREHKEQRHQENQPAHATAENRTSSARSIVTKTSFAHATVERERGPCTCAKSTTTHKASLAHATAVVKRQLRNCSGSPVNLHISWHKLITPTCPHSARCDQRETLRLHRAVSSTAASCVRFHETWSGSTPHERAATTAWHEEAPPAVRAHRRHALAAHQPEEGNNWTSGTGVRCSPSPFAAPPPLSSTSTSQSCAATSSPS